jgi:hypothetical protein
MRYEEREELREEREEHTHWHTLAQRESHSEIYPVTPY